MPVDEDTAAKEETCDSVENVLLSEIQSLLRKESGCVEVKSERKHLSLYCAKCKEHFFRMELVSLNPRHDKACDLMLYQTRIHMKSTKAHKKRSRDHESTPKKTKKERKVFEPEGSRLYIQDSSTGLFHDLKKDRGRAVRYLRIQVQLTQLAQSHNMSLRDTFDDDTIPERNTREKSASLHDENTKLKKNSNLPPPLSSEETLDLAAVLLEKGMIDKVPVTRAADVRALDAARLRLETLVSASTVEEQRTIIIALLFIVHQLWTPSRMSAFVDELEVCCIDDHTSEFCPTIQWATRVRLALSAMVVKTAASDDMKAAQEVALENDVFTGRHKTRTTVFSIQDANWDQKWHAVIRVASEFVHHLWTANVHTLKVIPDEICLKLVALARKRLPGVGQYVGCHLLRSLLALFGLRLPAENWGAFTMSEDSVGVMRARLNLSPAQLADELAIRLERRASSRALAFRNEYRKDAGILALVLCELHGCCSLIERHRVNKRPWNYKAVMRLLESIPCKWVHHLRRLIASEYNRPDLFHPDIVYHAANKLLLFTMIGLGRHDVCVTRVFKPLHHLNLPSSPQFKLVPPLSLTSSSSALQVPVEEHTCLFHEESLPSYCPRRLENAFLPSCVSTPGEDVSFSHTPSEVNIVSSLPTVDSSHIELSGRLRGSDRKVTPPPFNLSAVGHGRFKPNIKKATKRQIPTSAPAVTP